MSFLEQLFWLFLWIAIVFLFLKPQLKSGRFARKKNLAQPDDHPEQRDPVSDSELLENGPSCLLYTSDAADE